MRLAVLALSAAAVLLTACAGQTANNLNATSNRNIAAATATPSNSFASAPGPTGSPAAVAVEDNSERISLADAKKAFDAGTAVFIDVRSPEAYKIEHIKGALNITVGDIDANINKIPKGKKVIAYCS